MLKESSDVDSARTIEIAVNSIPYKIQVGDFININVTNPDQASVAVFQKVGESLYATAYLVRNDGTIKIPLIGDFYVLGYNLIELQVALEKRLGEFFKFVTVDASLVNFKVTFLGEVNKQGVVGLTNERTNFFEVLSRAGGLTEYSSTKNVKIVRKEGNEVKVYYVDISSLDFISNEFYYLRPDDIVYIEPLKGKYLKTNISYLTVGLSIITLYVTIVTRLRR